MSSVCGSPSATRQTSVLFSMLQNDFAILLYPFPDVPASAADARFRFALKAKAFPALGMGCKGGRREARYRRSAGRAGGLPDGGYFFRRRRSSMSRAAAACLSSAAACALFSGLSLIHI